jgi:hypothetical protein
VRTITLLYVLVAVVIISTLGFLAVNTDGLTGLIASDITVPEDCELTCKNVCGNDKLCLKNCLQDVCMVDISGGAVFS